MENPNLKKALAVLAALISRQESQARALRGTDEAIERAKAEVAKLVSPRAQS